ncbi:MAG: glycoside hydrolase family 3 C-terminal domain-containing protein [Pseudomonadota bacterium]
MADVSSGLVAKHNEAQALVAQMTLAEKASFASGSDFWHLQGCERLGLKPVMVTDGPHGLRKQPAAADHAGANRSVPATCFPTASALAASWDRDLLRRVGVALGEQCVAENVTVLLGPGMNIKRHPVCGRNFEYFSEDPLLSGEMAAALILGVQSQGVGTSVKHFAVNNQEYARMFVDAVVDPRTLREIYLRGFEIAVTKAQPWTVMCAYNRVNGVYCSEHDWLLNTVLRDEWGFAGLVMTDWGATNDRPLGVQCGLDLEMPGSNGINDKRVIEAVQRGTLDESALDKAIVRNVSLSLCGADLEQRATPADQLAHHDLARQVAEQSAVLLKNDGQLLPIHPQQRIALIGAFAKKPRYQGTGSSQVNPTQLDNAFEALVDLVGVDGFEYAAGYEPVYSAEDDALIAEAVACAAKADVAVVVAGLPVTYESEGFDRGHMRLPAQHNRLIEEVCAANENVVVVLANGAPVEMPWVGGPKAVLEVYLAGQAGGSAMINLLFGHVNPSGKLAETFPERQSDVACDKWFPGGDRQVQYREGLYVGYRYFDSAGTEVLFPFGHGLSYTSFAFTNLRIEPVAGGYEVRVKLKNTGTVSGAEVVQVYVNAQQSPVYHPVQELAGYLKIQLQPGQETEVVIPLERRSFEYWDEATHSWRQAGERFEIRVGASSRDLRLHSLLDLPTDESQHPMGAMSAPEITPTGLVVDDQAFAHMLGCDVPAGEASRPFHINTAVEELESSWLGRKVQTRVIETFIRSMGVSNMKDPTLKKMFEEMANQMPLRALVLFSRGKVTFKQLHILIALMNHRYFLALRIWCGLPGSFARE